VDEQEHNKYTADSVEEVIKLLNNLHQMVNVVSEMKCDEAAKVVRELHNDLLNSFAIEREINCAARFKLSQCDGNEIVAEETVDVNLYGETESVKLIADALSKYELIRQAFVAMGGDVKAAINQSNTATRH
jgi:hypothetical protein